MISGVRVFRGGMRWVVVVVALVASSLALLAIEPAGATVSYRDQVLARGPMSYYRLGEASEGPAMVAVDP